MSYFTHTAADIAQARRDGIAEGRKGRADVRVVVLCGSTRFRDEFAEVNRELTMGGAIVLAPGVFGHSGDPLTEADKTRLDELHLRKIDMADEVHVVCPSGYIGESTLREIGYAQAAGKPVGYWSDSDAARAGVPVDGPAAGTEAAS